MTDRELLELLVQKVTGIEKEVQEVKSTQLRMEQDHGDKIRALFDAREVQSDVNERIVSTLDRMEAKIDVLQLESARMRRIK